MTCAGYFRDRIRPPGREGTVVTAIITLVVLGGLVLVGLMLAGIYNSLTRKRVAAQTAWADVDVQLKRRYDLIPNLVNTVKGYAAHEKDTLERVIAARQRAVDSRSVGEAIEANNALTSALGRLMAISEAYPDLKANTNFMQLQEELTSTENKIGFARQNYNRNASQYNEGIAVFPSNIVAGMFNFARMDFFEVTDATVREAPKVAF
jgi:LemA protein